MWNVRNAAGQRYRRPFRMPGVFHLPARGRGTRAGADAPPRGRLTRGAWRAAGAARL